MSEAFPAAQIIVGVDTHKHVHAAVAIIELGARLGRMTVPAKQQFVDCDTFGAAFRDPDYAASSAVFGQVQ